MLFSKTNDQEIPSLRQIALVVDGLDRAAADSLLERLPESHERAVRDELMELHQVDAQEQESAARDFYGKLMGELGYETNETAHEVTGVDELLAESNADVGSKTGISQAGVAVAATTAAAAAAAIVTPRLFAGDEEVDESQLPGEAMLGQEVVGEEVDASYPLPTVDPGSATYLDEPHADEYEPETSDVTDRLELSTATSVPSAGDQAGVESIPAELLPLREVITSHSLEVLSRVLKHEQLQTVALVMAAMLPGEAASFIVEWSQSDQGEILRRIAKMQSADPLVVEAVREELMQELDRFASEKARGEQGRDRVQKIVAAAQGSVKQDLLGGLADADRELFRQVAMAADQASSGRGSDVNSEFDPHLAAVAFDRLVDLSDVGLEKVFAELDPEVSVLALAGASQPCLSDVLERLPRGTSDDLRTRMERIGPLRLGDIQRAQLMAVAASHHVLLSDVSERDTTRHLKLSA